MSYSEDFFRKIRKDKSDAVVEQAFLSCIPGPSEMAGELYNTIQYENKSKTESGETVEFYAAIIDLFNEEPDYNMQVIPGNIWEVIRDIVNSYAEELDEDLMCYIFQQILNNSEL